MIYFLICYLAITYIFVFITIRNITVEVDLLRYEDCKQAWFWFSLSPVL